MNIGVFDSGRGGKYVADRLQEIFPDDHIRYVNDAAHVPYGNKTPEEIRTLTEAAIQPLLENSCDAIVLACNTATTNAIGHLRQKYPRMFFVGIEPMIKPAAHLTKTGRIAICATPATLASPQYRALKQRYASGITVIEPDCAPWASLIEYDRAEEIDAMTLIENLRQQQVDVIVLGCTHYHYLKDKFVALAPEMRILEPTDAIAQRIERELTTILSQPQ